MGGAAVSETVYQTADRQKTNWPRIFVVRAGSPEEARQKINEYLAGLHLDVLEAESRIWEAFDKQDVLHLF